MSRPVTRRLALVAGGVATGALLWRYGRRSLDHTDDDALTLLRAGRLASGLDATPPPKLLSIVHVVDYGVLGERQRPRNPDGPRSFQPSNERVAPPPDRVCQLLRGCTCPSPCHLLG